MTTVLELIARIERQVPEGAPFGTRERGTLTVRAPVGPLVVAVAARIDHKGRRRLQYWCNGIRVERHVLLRLTCPEGECPQARAIRMQWLEWRRETPLKPVHEAPVARPLIEDVPIKAGRSQCTARPASFRCFTPCPNRAHPPMLIDKTGYDLFEDGACVGGGLVERDGVKRPRLPTLQAAEAFLFARQLEALAAVAEARGPAESGEL
ncbi:hypothetical protein HLB44_31330 [Aquincola sp. S2]|uniref:Uncharacterized protein n=1 Tax=Pseudaquabacterium terrae TaxID=2732868 RepID=A0ABX2ESG6_9BURK|nr:hypothetical protein [Aquabacterium terrae]NRF71489.1 hypothetical protein [Aquabacterium terrae]